MATLSTACIILIIAGTAFSNPSNRTLTKCSHGSDLEQTVPLFIPCGKELDRNGDLVQTIPVVVPASSLMYERCPARHGFRRGHRICRFQGTASSTPPSPDKQYSSGSHFSKSAMSNDESTSKPTTPSATTPTTLWLETTMPTVPGSTSPEITPATTLQENSVSQTTLYETSIPETTSTEAVHKTYPKTDSKSVTMPYSTPSSVVLKPKATPTKSASTPMQPTSLTTQTRTTSVETQAYNIFDTTNKPTSQAPNLSVATSTHSPSVISQTSVTSVTTEIPKTSDTIPTPTVGVTNQLMITSTTKTPTTVTTHTPTTSATTEIPTASVTTQTPTSGVTTQIMTTPATIQTPTIPVTTQTPTTATTQTPTTTATTQIPTTTVTTKPSTTRSSTTSPSITDFTLVGYYKVFVTDHQDKRILWADLHGPNSLQFSVFRMLQGKPSDVTFDPEDQKLYWSDNDNKKIWRSGPLPSDEIEEVTRQNSDDKPLGIVIAEHSRHLYFTYESKGWIHSVNLWNPDSEETFVEGLNKPKALAIDENNGFLYWSRHEGIDRKRLDGTMGIEQVIYMSSFSKMFGLTINTEGTRIFFCDENSKEGLYYDIGSDSRAVRLIDSSESFVLRDVNLVDDSVLYWLQSGNKRILEMTNYKSNTDFTVRAENAFGNPQRIHIARINTVT